MLVAQNLILLYNFYIIAFVDTETSFSINTKDTGPVDFYQNPTSIHLMNEKLSDYGVNTSNIFQLIFELRACGDSFILLSETADLVGAVIFELVIGCYGNTRFCINKPGTNQETIFTGPILDCNNFNFFWLKWTNYGDVSFGTGEIIGLNQLSLKSTGKNIGGLGVRSGYGNDAVWKGVISAMTTERLPTSRQTTLSVIATSESSQVLPSSMSKCVCPCLTSSNPQSTDESALGPYKVDKKSLSSQKRKLTSASDPRQSSMYIGTVGVVMLLSFISFIIMLDCVPSVRKE